MTSDRLPLALSAAWRLSAALIDGLSFSALIANTAFDSNTIIADLDERAAKVVIAQHERRTQKLPIDADIYKWRQLIEP